MKRNVLSLNLVLSATWLFLACAAGHSAGALTPAQLRDGWIQIFDGKTLFGWESRGSANWRIEEGSLICRANDGTGYLTTTTEFVDFELHAEFRADPQTDSGIFLRAPLAGKITSGNAYEVSIGDTHSRYPTGSLSGIARTTVSPERTDRWRSIDVTLVGDECHIRIDGRTTAKARSGHRNRGVIALQQWDGKGLIAFRNVRVKPVGLKSIFNGRDLAGWKEIPGRKSVYSVTPEGWLNVRDGNGDLQTVAQYGDFVFQLDIISNGTHLNSGVFFRAMAGQFWSGYESQIRNQWNGNDRTQPVDFGTGGIYNHQPARRVVSSDREWFAKTIVAHGPHLAVWIDGVQVSDFTDTRPPRESARQGYRAAPGVISLQGHDPTTDLSFRNLRLAEMPPARD